MSRRHLFVSFCLLVIVSVFFSDTKPANANSLFLQDNFNNSSLDSDKWSLSNFAVEESGTNSPYGELGIAQVAGELVIFGTKSNTDTVDINGVTVGNLGRALVTKNNIPFSGDIEIEVKTKIVDGDIGYELILFVEFDSNNRVEFNLQRINEGKFVQLVFEESDIIRCPINNELNGCSVWAYNFPDNTFLNLKITLERGSNKISAFVDNNLVAWGIFNGNFPSLKTGIAATERVPNRSVDTRFDDFIVTIEGLITPTLIPTSQPSPSPIRNLQLTDIKQFSAPWGVQEYDSATNWYPKNPTISRWGCALTSASMVLNYHGGSTSPESLNNWLKSNNGYSRNGGILWPSVSRYSLLDPKIPTLEFTYLNYTDSLLKEEIDQDRPSILKLENKTYGGNHFIVGKGYNDENLLINDPGSNTNSTLSQANSYWGPVLKLGRFKPSNTDLSYIVLMIDKGFSIKVIGTDGNEISGDVFYFQEGAMIDPENPDEDSGIPILNAFYFPKPSSGEFKIEVEGSGVYQLDSYVYDRFGIAVNENLVDSVDAGDKDNFILDFNETDSDSSNLPKTNFSFESIIEDINNAYSSGQITNHDAYMSIKKQVEISWKFFDKGKSFVSEVHLKNAIAHLLFYTPQYVETSSSKKLENKIILLLNTY